VLKRRRPAASPEPEPSEQERQIMSGLRSLRQATARELMTPRVDVDALEAPVRLSDVARAVRRSGHSHFPVYEDDLDHLLGVLFVKDLFKIVEEAIVEPEDPSAHGGQTQTWGAPPALDVTARLREPYIVPESRSALEILAEMRRRRRGFAVVVDEHGGFAGVLSINDLVGELVGELRDEFDLPASPSIVRLGAGRFLVDGACAVSEVRETLGAEIPDGEYVTLGGFLFDLLGHIPEVGEVAEHAGWTYRITRMSRRRIEKVVVQAPSARLETQSGK
jgi:putative hemolysin